jgi:pimeloyl-ACP methyl ester carboxylesterase
MLAASSADAQEPPLSIRQQGYFFVGQNYKTVDGKQYAAGQAYVEFQIPAEVKRPYPIIMVHGGSQSGTNFTGTPDGREGWAQHFLRQGYAVYVVDQVGRGRAAYRPEVYAPAASTAIPQALQRFVAPERDNLWPQAKLHTQWPGRGELGDPDTDQFMASQLPSISDFAQQQRLNRTALVALLDKIGPSILLTHSQSGAFGWPVADDRPELVKALVQVEPSGPPVRDLNFVGPPEWFKEIGQPKPWGLGSEPLTFSPTPAGPEDLKFVQEEKPEAPDLARCWRQTDPARQLIRLQKVPVLILTSEASYHAPYDHCTARFVQQAGVKAQFVRLQDVGITGNNHMMMLERNSAEIARFIEKWVAETIRN